MSDRKYIQVTTEFDDHGTVELVHPDDSRARVIAANFHLALAFMRLMEMQFNLPGLQEGRNSYNRREILDDIERGMRLADAI